LALNAGDRVQKIVLCNPSAKIGTSQSWNDRIDLVKNEGLEKLPKTPLKNGLPMISLITKPRKSRKF